MRHLCSEQTETRRISSLLPMCAPYAFGSPVPILVHCERHVSEHLIQRGAGILELRHHRAGAESGINYQDRASSLGEAQINNATSREVAERTLR